VQWVCMVNTWMGACYTVQNGGSITTAVFSRWPSLRVSLSLIRALWMHGHQRPVQQSEHSRLFACARFWRAVFAIVQKRAHANNHKRLLCQTGLWIHLCMIDWLWSGMADTVDTCTRRSGIWTYYVVLSKNDRAVVTQGWYHCCAKHEGNLH
jgi:hypothetical protein